MGLDVIAFEHATPVLDHLNQTECDEHYVAYADCFPQSFRGLEDGRCYELSGLDFGFRAGSYSGYNEWRDNLAQRALGVSAETVWADERTYATEPFFELINFADNEGSIGPEAAADLAADFRDLRAKVNGLPLDDPDEEAWFMACYDNFAHAFDLVARGNGLVSFG